MIDVYATKLFSLLQQSMKDREAHHVVTVLQVSQDLIPDSNAFSLMEQFAKDHSDD